MADNAILASLLMGQKKRRDPFELQRQYGMGLMQQGANVAPLQSGNPLEGVARALTAGVGGYFAGKADRDADERDQRTTSLIGELLTAKSPDEIKAKLEAAKASGVDTDVLNPIMGSILTGQMADQRKAVMGQRAYAAAGGMPGQGGPPVTLQGTPPPQGIPQPGYGAENAPSAVTGGAFANNSGNIRASGVPWDGKGAPQNGFETFATPQAGANAHFKNFQAYAQANPTMTVAQAIAKWSPPNENNTQGVIQTIAEQSGINPGMPLAEVLKDPMVAARLLDAQTRLEKGGMPQGFGADTFIAAAGGPGQAAPGQPGQIAQPPQIAQGTDGSGNPPRPGPSFDPGADYESLGRRAAEGGDFERATAYQMKANEARTAFKIEQAKDDTKRAGEGSEWDRRQAEEQRQKIANEQRVPANNEQTVAAGFADRMVAANQAIDRFGKEGASKTGRLLEALPFGLGNSVQSPEYQQFEQARRDFINSLLRRESGAAIGVDEFKNADKQYFPQPGDSEAVIAQKAQNRALAIEGLKRGAGPSYKPATAPAAQSGASDVVQQARDAIAKGAPREQVIKRLQGMGVPTDGL